MKICYFGSFSGGGTEKATFAVANELCQNADMEIHILSTGKNGNTFYLDPQIVFTRLLSCSVFGRNKEVFQYILKNRIDVFITIEAITGIFSIIPVGILSCRHIIWEHANYFQNQGSKYIQKIRQIELYLSDAYVLLTKRDLKNFETHFKIRTRLEYIYNIAGKQKNSNYDINSKTIVSVGHNRIIKNFISIPDIAKKVFSKHSDWCWKIYGTSQKSEEEGLLQKIREYGLDDKVLLCGWCSNMEAVYQKAAMYVLTSLQEGLPMVLLEAKTNKLPLISFDIETGPDEIILDGENGFLVKPYDLETMAYKINMLIENPDLRREFAENSSWGLDAFYKEKIAEKWRYLINDISG